MRPLENTIVLLMVMGLVGMGCKNNTTTAPNADHPLDFTIPAGAATIGSGFNDFDAPMGLCVDGSDNLYVADYGNNRIKQYNSNGVCQAIWGGPATMATVAATIKLPYGLALDNGGNILEVDNGTAQVQRFSTGGALLGQFGSFNVPTWIASGPGGVNLVSDDTGVTDSALGGILPTPGGSTFGHYALDPTGLAYDSAGNIYVGDLGNRRVDVYDSAGAPVSIGGKPYLGKDDFVDINGMAFDRQGNLLVVDTGARKILKFSSTGVLLESWMPDTVAQPIDVAVDSTGAVWVSLQDTNQAFLAKFQK